MEKIVQTGNKIDFHIHSFASKHKESDNCVDNSTIQNVKVLVNKLNERKINMCSISDHDNFDYELYKRLKEEEGNGSIKKVFPAVEFSVVYSKKVLHIITIFNDFDDSKISKIQKEIFDIKKNKPKYDDKKKLAFSEKKFLDIIRNLGMDVVMIAHQKAPLSSKSTRKHDAKDLGEKKFNELVFLEYFESFEFKNKRNEIFNKYYMAKNKEKYKDKTLRFITGSDCHDWKQYPIENEDFYFTYLKCLPTFRGLAMAVTNVKRINYINNFYSQTDSYLKSIDLSINGKGYNVELSKGINVIIGDNSIGKSLLLHKITDYKYLKDDSKKDSYNQYLSDKNIKILTSIDCNNISRFDYQGAIRNMFESKNFDTNEIIKDFFPVEPLNNDYINKYKSEIDRYVSDLSNKEKVNIYGKKLGSLKIVIQDENSKTLNLKNIPQNLISSINSKIRKIGNIITCVQNINANIDKILANDYLEKDDKEYLISSRKRNLELIEKYNKFIKLENRKISTINVIDSIFIEKMKVYSKTKTNASEKISIYEDSKDTFVNNIVEYCKLKQNETIFIPNIKTESVNVSENKVGERRFVIKPSIKQISNDNLIAIISDVIGKKIKNINDIDPLKIPEKFGDSHKEISYDEKLNNLKNALNNEIDAQFQLKKAINNSNDTDVTSEFSSGFNSKVYFNLISNKPNDNKIYIIDQPEDDVSQLAIKNSILEDFNNMSKNKQILMVTHNPQFIVNLDVDNVIFISKDAEGNLFIENGSLEYYDENYDILKIVADNIEGGIESINERWKRYEKNIYNV